MQNLGIKNSQSEFLMIFLTAMVNDLKNKIEQVLNKLRPAIENHGGGVRLVSVVNGVVKLKIKGACVGCPMAGATFDLGVGEELKKIKGVKKVEYC